jgi:trans-aconitate 2-methyltransferase
MAGMTSWDPAQYARFAAERARPFHELVARIPTQDAVAVVDLGCGPGGLTATLAERWPSAAVLGLDSSPEMIAAAAAHATDRVSFRAGDIAAWRPAPGSVDVIVANASLHWVPGHETLIPAWVKALDKGGTIAFQMPVTGATEATLAINAVAREPRFADRLAAVADGIGPRGVTPALTPERYVTLLATAGLEADVWETTYYHLLPGDDPVFEWLSGTGLRPYLDALADRPEALADFTAAVKERLRDTHPRTDIGTVMKFPRLFVVGASS